MRKHLNAFMQVKVRFLLSYLTVKHAKKMQGKCTKSNPHIEVKARVLSTQEEARKYLDLGKKITILLSYSNIPETQ